jgi:hypothetical protein
MRVTRRGPWHTLLTLLLAGAILVLGACGDDDDDATGGGGGGSDDEQALEDAVRATARAENAKDVDAFLALWTDAGLAEYDVGTREEVQSGESEIGQDKVEIVEFSDTTVTGNTGTTTVDAVVGEANVAKAVFRVKFKGLKEGDEWKLNGFEFVGSPPPGEDTEVVDVKAVEYAFQLSASEAPADLAFKFSNTGKEQHEIALFKGPAEVSLSTAKAALENVDGSELEDIPAGYEVDHLTFAEAGDSSDITFAEPLEEGTYVLACYLPQGGLDEEGEPVNPDGKPHIQLGMITLLTVT